MGCNQTSVLIMSAGDASRFDSQTPKQLMQIPGAETVFSRQLRQIRENGCEPTVITHNSNIISVSNKHFIPQHRETLCNSILSSESLWLERNVIILGDVIFTKDGIDLVFSTERPVFVVGNEAEIYALSFTRSHAGRVQESLQLAAGYQENASKGKLRYFYKDYTGLPIYGRELERNVLVWLRDETNDIDSMDEYVGIVARWNKGNG